MLKQEKQRIYISKATTPLWRLWRKLKVFYWNVVCEGITEIKYTFKYGHYYFSRSRDERIKFRRKLKWKRKYPSQFRNRKKQIKKKLALRDGASCRYCIRYNMQPLPGLKELTIDHIVPLAHGGTSDLSNLQLLCRHHHDIKDNTHGKGYTKKNEKVWFQKKKIYAYEILTFAKGVLKKEAEEDY